ncbi:MAG TPA: winged helix-turn-helix domain-containing protein [Verrucomicrobiae bacterium]|nr:winged helix-turn-helix domain-containing protein [Verrucomicrobiae bacterium]
MPAAARAAIRVALADVATKGTNPVYQALMRKVWSLLTERRFDAEIRDWHVLLHDLRAHLKEQDEELAGGFKAFADLLRHSVKLAETSPASAVAARPNARKILYFLGESDGYVARQALLHALGLRSANLSNVLTQLLAHNLIERRDKGKEAEFRITRLGRQLSGQLDAVGDQRQVLPDLNVLTELLRQHLLANATIAPLDASGSAYWITHKLGHGIGTIEELSGPQRGRPALPYHSTAPGADTLHDAHYPGLNWRLALTSRR